MNRLSDQALEAMLDRCARATPGPWKAFIEGRDHLGGDNFIQTQGDDMYLQPGASMEDHDFIAGARQDIPRLIDEIKALKHALSLIEKQ